MTHTPSPAWSAAALPGAKTRDLQSRDGVLYSVGLAQVGDAASAESCSAIYVLDGAEFFLTYAQIAHRMARRKPTSACLIVGIESKPASARRWLDFTFTPPVVQAEAHRDYGGGESFLRFVSEEVSAVAADACAKQFAKTALVGHSLSGLFALHALALRPQAFDAYAAFSPSLWWNPQAAIGALSHADLRQSHLTLTVGGREQQHGDERRAERAMVDRARALAETLGPQMASCRFRVLPDEDHATAPIVSWGGFMREWLAH